MSGPPPNQAALPTTLVPELLGFSPQMLLDDIIDAAADANILCMQAMEPFMQRWADGRTPRPGENWDGQEAVEQGLVAFATLLESHTDIAFDFFEAWSLRNIFALPPDLPIVAPHHKGLDLRPRPEEEAELMVEVEELRRKIENQRRLKRSYLKALRISRVGVRRTQRRLERLDYLADKDNVDALTSLPEQVHELFENVASLPHLDPTATTAPPLPDPSKRPWESSKTGYINWAVNQLVAKSKEQEFAMGLGPSRSTIVENTIEQTQTIGEARDMKGAADAVKTRQPDDDGDDVHDVDDADGMDTT